MLYYKDSQLAKNSKAYELYMNWQKSKDNKDKKLLDQHMKDVEAKGRDLMERYK